MCLLEIACPDDFSRKAATRVVEYASAPSRRHTEDAALMCVLLDDRCANGSASDRFHHVSSRLVVNDVTAYHSRPYQMVVLDAVQEVTLTSSCDDLVTFR